jgi:hypothetical protein
MMARARQGRQRAREDTMGREIIRVEPLSTYLERWKAPTSAVTRHGDTVYVSGLPPFDPDTGEIVDAPIERQRPAAGAAGLDAATAGAAAKRVTSGDPAGMLSAVPPAIRDTLHAAGLAAFADGFAAASLLAAGVAVVACLPAFLLVGREDTAAPGGTPPRPCGIVDCRDPL